MAAEFKFLKVKIDKGVALVTLDRPDKMNSLSMAVRDEIEQCFTFLETSKDVGSVVLTGGEDTFCPGFDIVEVINVGIEAFTHRILEYHRNIYGFTKPIVAAVSGFALAGGFDLALCGDIIIASETAMFGHPEIRFGVNPLLTPLWRKVGLSKAVEIAMMGEMINAEQAHRIGLVSKVVALGGVVDAAFEVARKLTKVDLRALAAVKRASMVAPRLDIEAGLEYEFGFTAAIFQESNLKSKVEAYARKIGLIE
jgi:enoyl-CoA hydratase/carnithine racemase